MCLVPRCTCLHSFSSLMSQARDRAGEAAEQQQVVRHHTFLDTLLEHNLALGTHWYIPGILWLQYVYSHGRSLPFYLIALNREGVPKKTSSTNELPPFSVFPSPSSKGTVFSSLSCHKSTWQTLFCSFLVVSPIHMLCFCPSGSQREEKSVQRDEGQNRTPHIRVGTCMLDLFLENWLKLKD